MQGEAAEIGLCSRCYAELVRPYASEHDMVAALEHRCVRGCVRTRARFLFSSCPFAQAL